MAEYRKFKYTRFDAKKFGDYLVTITLLQFTSECSIMCVINNTLYDTYQIRFFSNENNCVQYMNMLSYKSGDVDNEQAV
jgi:hypothetical protein